jgi:hypothetical protein
MRKTTMGIYRYTDKTAKVPLWAKAGCETHIPHPLQPNDLWNGREEALKIRYSWFFTPYSCLTCNYQLALSQYFSI